MNLKYRHRDKRGGLPGLSLPCMQNCELCKIGDDQYCTKVVMTYNGDDWGEGGANTMGGYSDRIVVSHK